MNHQINQQINPKKIKLENQACIYNVHTTQKTANCIYSVYTTTTTTTTTIKENNNNNNNNKR